MPPRKKLSKRRKRASLYPIHQCLLYKVMSLARLAKVLCVELDELNALLSDCDSNYIEFTLQEDVNPFSGKVRKERDVQEPKRRLRILHDRILYLLQGVEPPLYAHASVSNKSYRSNALAHKDGDCVSTFDIKGFYPSTGEDLILNFFKNNLRCSDDVSRALASLCVYKGVLPTGSPLSPLLALFSVKPMFDRLDKLASSMSLKFTCYVDDLTFSGDKAPRSLERRVISILKQYGYSLSKNKTKRFLLGQPKHITGTVIVDGSVSVPHGRFVAVRKITQAIEGRCESHSFNRMKLYEKLIGTLNEASYLDSRYASMAALARKDFAQLLKKIDKT